MGIREDVLALADDVESTIGGCYGCLLDKRGLCKAESDFDCNDEVCKFVAHRLRAIAEKDAENVTTVSAYDLLPEDERKAIAWVREQGGLEAVKASVHQGTREHGYLLKIAEMLGTSIYDGTGNADALLDKLEKRLMPEGMEWPRFEDGEPVKYGDEFADGLGNTRKCQSVELLGEDDGVCVWQGERVKRPAPKVLDADGVEIHEGDEVWTDYGDGPWTVTKITTAHAWHVYGHSAELGSLDMQPNLLTHRAPVLAADGKPIREGETVYEVEGTGYAYKVVGIRVGDGDRNPLTPTVVICDVGDLTSEHFLPSQLTHERPDSWKRLEEDVTLSVERYRELYGIKKNDGMTWPQLVRKDLVRRAKKLAERGA